MAACTFRFSKSLTGTDPVITCETVPTATPARSATSLIVAILLSWSELQLATPLALHVLQSNIPRLDFHRAGSHVQLNADQSRHLPPRLIVVDDLAHYPAV